jgi:sugar O-acyltransferase (sialic acid O-acetyltransferase NeuD family)
MIIVGAGGCAKQFLPSLLRKDILKQCLFYDDITQDKGGFIHQNFNLIRSEEDLKKRILCGDKQFIIAIGSPVLRKSFFEKIEALGGEPASLIDPKSSISEFDVKLNHGIVILEGVIIETGAQVGKGCLVNLRAILAHDCLIGDFCELSPGSILLGGCEIGDNTFVGAGAVVLPKVIVGKNCIIGAGSIVTKDLPDHSKVAGVPARALDL